MAELEQNLETALWRILDFVLPPAACNIPNSLWNVAPMLVNDPDCLRAALSRCIGLGIVLFAGLIKFPQIIAILSAKSVDGLSTTTFLVETFGYTYNLAAHYRKDYPISTYGDFAMLILQNYFIIYLCYAFTKRAALGGAVVIGYIGLLALMCTAFFPVEIVDFLTLLNIPVVIVGRMPQIYANFQNGSTGTLSAITSWGIFLGASARIFTTLQDVDSKNILLGYVVSATLNGILAFQVLYYGGAKPVAAKDVDKKKQ